MHLKKNCMMEELVPEGTSALLVTPAKAAGFHHKSASGQVVISSSSITTAQVCVSPAQAHKKNSAVQSTAAAYRKDANVKQLSMPKRAAEEQQARSASSSLIKASSEQKRAMMPDNGHRRAWRRV